MTVPHIPVLLEEVLQTFQDRELKYFIDGTIGAGGHAESLLQQHPELSVYLALDRDPTALNLAKKRLAQWTNRVCFVRSNFSHLQQVAKEQKIPPLDGILLDIGVSSMQMDQAERGFSLRFSGPLDMRMDPDAPLTAAEIVNTWGEEDLARIFWRYGEERRSRAAARAIVRSRESAPLQTTEELVKVLDPVLRTRKDKRGIHPATLVFQALRIVVNQELEVLQSALEQAVDLLAPDGCLAVITFHSLEDRMVKRYFRELASDKVSTSGKVGVFIDKTPVGKLVYRKAIKPSLEEIEKNPRSRSARLRVFQKLRPDEVK